MKDEWVGEWMGDRWVMGEWMDVRRIKEMSECMNFQSH
jgi:hypothetical protein